jgi:hypothetical protein
MKIKDDRRASYQENVGREPAEVTPKTLSVVVPFTTSDLTRAALRHSVVCSDLDIQVSLVDIQTVPFPCPLSQSPIDKEYSHRRLRELLKESGLRGDASIVYTRDWLDGFRKVLGPRSVVVMATRNRWWPTREKRLARALSKAGHHVMLLPVVR